MLASFRFNRLTTLPPAGSTLPGSANRYSTRPACGARTDKSPITDDTCAIFARACPTPACASLRAASAACTAARAASRCAKRVLSSACEIKLSRNSWRALSASICAVRSCWRCASICACARRTVCSSCALPACASESCASAVCEEIRASTVPASTNCPSLTVISSTRPAYRLATSMRANSSRPLACAMLASGSGAAYWRNAKKPMPTRAASGSRKSRDLGRRFITNTSQIRMI